MLEIIKDGVPNLLVHGPGVPVSERRSASAEVLFLLLAVFPTSSFLPDCGSPAMDKNIPWTMLRNIPRQRVAVSLKGKVGEGVTLMDQFVPSP